MFSTPQLPCIYTTSTITKHHGKILVVKWSLLWWLNLCLVAKGAFRRILFFCIIDQ